MIAFSLHEADMNLTVGSEQEAGYLEAGEGTLQQQQLWTHLCSGSHPHKKNLTAGLYARGLLLLSRCKPAGAPDTPLG